MSHPSRDHADIVPSATGASQAGHVEKGLSPWERERVQRRAFALWRDEGFPRTTRRDHWGLAQLQVLKNYPKG